MNLYPRRSGAIRHLLLVTLLMPALLSSSGAKSSENGDPAVAYQPLFLEQSTKLMEDTIATSLSQENGSISDSTVDSGLVTEANLSWSGNAQALTIKGCQPGDQRFLDIDSRSLCVLRSGEKILEIPISELGNSPPPALSISLLGEDGSNLGACTSELMGYNAAYEFYLGSPPK